MAFVMNHADEVPPNTAHMPKTVQALMSIILVRDIRSKTALGNPGVPLKHICEMVTENAWHGGMWMSPYSMKSTAIYVYGKYYSKYAVLLLGLVGLALYYYSR